jgi:hypothetical protein
MGVMQQMIGARVPLGEQLISCKNTAVSGYPMQRLSAMPRRMATSAGFAVDGNKMKGMFHQFDPKMRECLLTVAIEDVPVTISTNRDDLDKQREAKRKKEEMIEKKSLDKAKEDLVKASYYWEMYHSKVCWKGKLSVVTKMLGRLKSESAKMEALKENIRMSVI